MRVVVTGGSGFLGTNLIDHLISDGHVLVNIDVATPRCVRHMQIWHQVDIRDKERLASAIRDFEPDVVIHMAARTDLRGQRVEDYDSNTVGTANVLDAAMELDSPPLTLFASSRLVFAINHKPRHPFDYAPSTAYGRSKVEMEQLVLKRAPSGGPWAIVRPTSIWGPWFGTPYRDFFDAVRHRRYFNVQGYNPRKSFGYVGNAVHIVGKLIKLDRNVVNSRVLWLSDYEPIFVREFASEVADAFGVRRPATLPRPLLNAAARAGDAVERLTSREAPLTSFRLNNLLTDMVYGTSETEALIGALPWTHSDGIEATVGWIRNQEQR